jgi:predicted chitinase
VKLVYNGYYIRCYFFDAINFFIIFKKIHVSILFKSICNCKHYFLSKGGIMEDKIVSSMRRMDLAEGKALDASRAISFFTASGSSALSNARESEKPKVLPPSCLRSPTENTVNALTQVAKKFNNDIDKVKVIIISIFKSCLLFNVSDVNQIAYILATISHEAKFGKTMEEDDSYLLHFYEPVFRDTDAIENNAPIKSTGGLYWEFKCSELNLIENIRYLYTTFSNNQLNSDDNEALVTLLESLHKQADKVLADVDDSFLNVYIAALDAKQYDDLCKKFVNGKINRLIPQDLKTPQPPYVAPMLAKISTIQIQKADENVTDFYTLQLKVLLIDWLLTRVEKSTDLGNFCQGDGETYKGHGLVQLTGRSSYKNFTDLFKTNSRYTKALTDVGVDELPDLEETPLLATDPKIASVIAVGGMAEGRFRPPRKAGDYNPRKLSQYTLGDSSMFDFIGARDIINSDKNRLYDKGPQKIGEHVKEIAESYIPALLTI